MSIQHSMTMTHPIALGTPTFCPIREILSSPRVVPQKSLRCAFFCHFFKSFIRFSVLDERTHFSPQILRGIFDAPPENPMTLERLLEYKFFAGVQLKGMEDIPHKVSLSLFTFHAFSSFGLILHLHFITPRRKA